MRDRAELLIVILTLLVAGCDDPRPERFTTAPSGERPSGPAALTPVTTRVEPPGSEPPTSGSDPSPGRAPGDPTPTPEPHVPSPEPPRPTLLEALLPAAPDAVAIDASRVHSGEEIVLFRVRGSARWVAAQPPATIEAALEAAEERADACDESNEGSWADCVLGAYPNPYHGWERIHATPVWDVELARVKHQPSGAVTVLARRSLYEVIRVPDTPAMPVDLRVRDVDGDGDPEITAVFPVDIPQHYSGETTSGTVGFLLAWADLHAQFRTTRQLHSEMGDAGPNTLTVETTWRAIDLNADGRADLRVRERRTRLDADDPESPAVERTETRTADCLWQNAGDVWSCPVDLGADLFPAAQAP